MNILSVDIDFLFRDMNLIQKYFDVDLSPIRSWKVVNWKTKGKKFEPDAGSAKFLNILINKSLHSGTKVVRIEEHNEIIKVLEENNCVDSDVYNVDYHHDISYSNDNNDKLTIENWVTKGRDLGLIKKYNWICQDDSCRCEHGAINHTMTSWKDLDFDYVPKMDLIVLCTSRHFTPPKYWGLCKEIENDINYRLEKIILGGL